MGFVWTHIEIVLGILASGTAIIWVLQQRRSPQSALAWILFILMLPYLAVPMFFVFGVRKWDVERDEITFAMAPTPPPRHPFDADLRAFAIPPATSGNRLRFDADARAARETLRQLATGAHESLEISLYRLDPDAFSNDFIDWLTDAANRGVEVRLLLDQVGTVRRPRRALRALTRAGGRVTLSSPIPRLPVLGRFNSRNHRKMLLADGKTLWSGGRNVGRVYLGAADDPHTWHDLSFTLEGPAVARYHEVFEADWAKETGDPCRAVAPVPATEGTVAAQLIPSGPDLRLDALHDVLLKAILTAEHRVWIATPYFLPTDELYQALVMAARLGRDIRLMIPHRSNQPVADFARGAYVRHLDALGCTVLQLPDRMLHAKAMIVDDMALVGSVNFDVRSMLLNAETALALYDPPSVAEVREWFLEEAARCSTGTKPARMPRRLAEALFRLGAPLL